MAILLYWYQHRCTINTTLIISTTSCQHVVLGCEGVPLNRRSEIAPKEHVDHVLLLWGKTVSVPSNGCSVYQLLPDEHAFLGRWHCKGFWLLGVPVLASGFSMVYDVKSYIGSLSPMHVLVCLKTKCQSLETKGRFAELCTNTNGKSTCLYQTTNKYIFYGEDKDDSGTRIFMHIKTTAPAISTNFQLKLMSYFTADSWVDVAVRKSNALGTNLLTHRLFSKTFLLENLRVSMLFIYSFNKPFALQASQMFVGHRTTEEKPFKN